MMSDFKYEELSSGMTWPYPAPDTHTHTLAFGAVLGVGLHATKSSGI